MSASWTQLAEPLRRLEACVKRPDRCALSPSVLRLHEDENHGNVTPITVVRAKPWYTSTSSIPTNLVKEGYAMRAWMATAGMLLFAAGVLSGGRWQTPVGAQGYSVVMECGAASAAQVRTTLYFGLARPKGSVSELEWQIFLRDEVTRRFPDGLTVWEAEGQWRTSAGSIDREQSRVLLLVHADTAAARQSVQSVIEAYRKAFDQQSVLWESARVCVAA